MLIRQIIGESLWLTDQVIMLMPYHIHGLVQERRNSIANALELRLSCTHPGCCRYLGKHWIND